MSGYEKCLWSSERRDKVGARKSTDFDAQQKMHWMEKRRKENAKMVKLDEDEDPQFPGYED